MAALLRDLWRPVARQFPLGIVPPARRYLSTPLARERSTIEEAFRRCRADGW